MPDQDPAGDQLEERIRAAVERAAGPIIQRALEPFSRTQGDIAGVLSRVGQALPLDPAVPSAAGRVLMCGIAAAQHRSYTHGLDWGVRVYGKDDPVMRALTTAPGSTGGFVLQPDMSKEIIDLALPRTKFLAAKPKMLNLPYGTQSIPKLTGVPVAAYVGESQPVASSQAAFSAVKPSFRKLTAVVPMSNDWIRYAIAGAEGLVRDKTIEVMAVRKDLACLRGDGAEAVPRGVRLWANANHVFASSGVTLAIVRQELSRCVRLLQEANLDPINAWWYFAPRTFWFLWNLADALGHFPFQEQLEKGMLLGYPVAVTNQIPINLGVGGNETEIYFCDMARVIFAQAMSLAVETFNEGSYWDGTQYQSLLARDESAIRVIEEHDLAVEDNRAIAVVTGFTGA